MTPHEIAAKAAEAIIAALLHRPLIPGGRLAEDVVAGIVEGAIQRALDDAERERAAWVAA